MGRDSIGVGEEQLRNKGEDTEVREGAAQENGRDSIGVRGGAATQK